jgi:hypothetical protein
MRRAASQQSRRIARYVVPVGAEARAKRMAGRITMRINLMTPLLACAIAAGPCLGGTTEAPAQGHGAELPAADRIKSRAPESAVFFHEATAPVPAGVAGNTLDIGNSVGVMRLDQLRGGQSTVDNDVLLEGTVDGNTVDHVASGSNAISDGAFSNASGINTVIQNTGSNVLIQNGMVVNVQFVAPVGP